MPPQSPGSHTIESREMRVEYWNLGTLCAQLRCFPRWVSKAEQNIPEERRVRENEPPWGVILSALFSSYPWGLKQWPQHTWHLGSIYGMNGRKIASASLDAA